MSKDEGLRISRLDPIPQDWTQEQINNLLNTGLIPVSNQHGTHTYKVILGLLSLGKIKLVDVVSAYSSEKRYVLNDWCTFDEKLYRCSSQYTYGEFNENDWTEQQFSNLIEYLLGSSKLYSVNSYSQEFDFDTMYNSGIVPVIVDNVSSANGAILRCSRVDNYTKTIDGSQQAGRIYTFSSIYLPNRNDSGYAVDRESNTFVTLKYYTLGVIGGNDKWQFILNKLSNKEYSTETVLLNQQSGAGQAPLYEATIEATRLTVINQRPTIPTSDIQQIKITVNNSENTDKPYFAIINASKIILVSSLVIKDINNNDFTPADNYSSCLVGSGSDNNKTYLIEFKPNKTFSVHRVNNNGSVVDQTRFIEVTKTDGKQYFDYVNYLINYGYIPFIKTYNYGNNYGLAFYKNRIGVYNTPIFATQADEDGIIQKITFDTNGSAYFVKTELASIVDVDCIYVDPINGLNTNNGLKENSPVQTVNRAYELMKTYSLNTITVIGNSSPVNLSIPNIPASLVLSSFRVIAKVDAVLNYETLHANTEIVTEKSVVVSYNNANRVNLTISAKGNVELHHHEPTEEATISNLVIKSKGTVYVNCVDYEGSYYEDDYLYYTISVNSIIIKCANAFICGNVKHGCDVTVNAEQNITNCLEICYYEENPEINIWDLVTQNYNFIAGNKISEIKGATVNSYNAKCTIYESDCNQTIIAKESVSVSATNKLTLTDVLVGSNDSIGNLSVIGGDGSESSVLDIRGINPYYDSEGSRSCYEYSPNVFIDWKGIIYRGADTQDSVDTGVIASSYFEKSLGYDENSAPVTITIPARYDNEQQKVVYPNKPIRIISDGLVHSVSANTGVDSVYGRCVPVYIKCKSFGKSSSASHNIFSHDIVIDAENSIDRSNYYFQLSPAKEYDAETYLPTGLTNTSIESKVKLITHKGNIEFVPNTNTNNSANQIFTVECANELIFDNLGNNGISAKVINIKAKTISGTFSHLSPEYHIDVDNYIANDAAILNIEGFGNELDNPKWSNILVTNSTFYAKSVIIPSSVGNLARGIISFDMTPFERPNVIRNLDVHIGIVVCSFNWQGSYYCPLFYSMSEVNGEISGEIGSIVNTYNGNIQRVTKWHRDLFFSNRQTENYNPVNGEEDGYYPQTPTGWGLSARISLQFAAKIIPGDIYIDPNQGDDRYDGLTKKTPVKTVVGLYRCLKNNFDLIYSQSNHDIALNNGFLTLHMLSGSQEGTTNHRANPYNKYTLEFVLTREMTNDTNLEEGQAYSLSFNCLVEVIPEAPCLSVSFKYFNCMLLYVHDFYNFKAVGLGGSSACIINVANEVEVDNNAQLNSYQYNSRRLSLYGFCVVKGFAIKLNGMFNNLRAIADEKIDLSDTYGASSHLSDNCCLMGSTYIKANYVNAGKSSYMIGTTGGTTIEASMLISCNIDTIIGVLNLIAINEVNGVIGSSYVDGKVNIKASSINLSSGSFSGTGNYGSGSNYPGSALFMEADYMISGGNSFDLTLYRCDLNIKTKQLIFGMITLYQDMSSDSRIEADIINTPIRYRNGNLKVKAHECSRQIERMTGGPSVLEPSSSCYNTLDVDIVEFNNSISIQSTPESNNYHNVTVNARIGTSYQPVILWLGPNPRGNTIYPIYILNVTVNNSRYIPSSGSTGDQYSNYGNVIPANATGEIQILNKMLSTPFQGATEQDNGSLGLVPAPASGISDRFLSSDGSWTPFSYASDSDIDDLFAERVVIGGRAYKAVTIGEQTWLTENLELTDSGIALSTQSNPIDADVTTPASWYYYDNPSTYSLDGTYKCGLLYNWYAVKYMEDHKNTLFPGWHVATDTDWETLINTIGNGAGTKLKSLDRSVTEVSWPRDWNGTDDYGFDMLPTGVRNTDDFDGISSYAALWTSSINSDSYSKSILFNTSSSVSTGIASSNKRGFAVRLVKDNT